MDISKYRDNIELSDICIVVDDHEYKLHKFPLSINCDYFKEHCKNQNEIILKKFPGNWQTFEFIADHCYGKEVNINEENVVSLLCASEFLGMTGKYNMVEKCQKMVDRLFRSAEYSKSIEVVISLMESALKLDCDITKAIITRGVAVIVDLWLRHLLNFKSNFKENFFEDTLVFEELLKLDSSWIERIIEYCSSDNNRHQYAGKLAMEYIRKHCIERTEDKMKATEEDEDKTSYDYSSGSSLSDKEKPEKHSRCCEKEAEQPSRKKKNKVKSATKENVGELFDKILFSLPDNAGLGRTASVHWLQQCLDFCDRYKCQSRMKLLKLCSGMLTQAPVADIKQMDPKNVREMIEQILCDETVDRELMKWIWDNNFLEMANNEELDPTIFCKVVKNMPESHDIDPDVVFQIVLSTLNKIGGDRNKYQNDLIDCVKLEEVSPDNLEVALESKFWNVEDVCKVALKRLKTKYKDSSSDKNKHEHYISRSYGHEDVNKDTTASYRYQNKNLSRWKSQSFTSHLNSFPATENDDYSMRPYEPIDNYYSTYKSSHSTYSPDSYLTMEENLRCELKKISDSYISYYKDRFPLKSRRRYQYSIPYDI